MDGTSLQKGGPVAETPINNVPSTAGTKHRQLVSMMPFTASRLGRILKVKIANPITWSTSKSEMKNCCETVGVSTFLKKQMRNARRNVISSGKANAKTMAHSQAILSVSSIWATNLLLVSEEEKGEREGKGAD